MQRSCRVDLRRYDHGARIPEKLVKAEEQFFLLSITEHMRFDVQLEEDCRGTAPHMLPFSEVDR